VLEKLGAQHKLTANQWKIGFAATIDDMLDFFDFGLTASVLVFTFNRRDRQRARQPETPAAATSAGS
jgi:hypothetical protein